MSSRSFLYLCLLSFIVTLALIIGWRLSDQAMAVIIGVVAGVAASVPPSLAVVALALQHQAGAAARVVTSTATPVPPQVIIVHAAPPAPPSPASQRSLTLLPAYASPEPTALNGQRIGPRQFTIMGDD